LNYPRDPFLVGRGCSLEPKIVRLGEMGVGVNDAYVLRCHCHWSPSAALVAGGSVRGTYQKGRGMPVADVDGLGVAYEVIGSGDQPWVITPGGRFSKDYGGVRQMAEELAKHGKQVLIWDRPNCGASDVCFTGSSESATQADTLAGLLRQLGM